jgi:NAD(P) transhydrogenase
MNADESQVVAAKNEFQEAVLGEQATEVVHIGMLAMLCQADAELFNRACFNYPTLGDLYKYATYDAMLQRLGG